MADRLDTVRSIYARHLSLLADAARAPTLRELGETIGPQAPEIADLLIAELMKSGTVQRLLGNREVARRFRDRVVAWVRSLFVVRAPDEIPAFVDQQLAIGRLYAVHVPMYMFDEALRLFKRHLSERVIDSAIARATLAEAVATLDDLVSLCWSLMKESFVSELADADTEQQITRALKTTLAVVLAGGRGSRLGPLTARRAKPAVPFGGKFRVIDFPLSNCVNSGIRRVSVLTQYKAQELIGHVQRGWGHVLSSELDEFVEIWPAQQQTAAGSWYLGTADAVYQNLELIQAHAPDYVLVLAGDHVYRQDYSRMLAQHLEHGIGATVSCIEVPVEQAASFGVMAVDAENNVTEFLEKPTHPPTIPGEPKLSLASMGIYLFDADFLYDELRQDAEDPRSHHDFGMDILPRMVEFGTLVAHRFSESCVPNPNVDELYWRDVGTLDAYWEANIDLTTVVPSLDLYDQAWPVRTYHMHWPAAKFVFDGDDRRGVAVDSLVSAGSIVSGGTVRRSLLGTDVRVNSHAYIEDSIVLAHVDVGRYARLRRCIIDEHCRIPAGLVVGEDPRVDAARFHRTAGGITLITAEMLADLM